MRENDFDSFCLKVANQTRTHAYGNHCITVTQKHNHAVMVMMMMSFGMLAVSVMIVVPGRVLPVLFSLGLISFD